MGENKMVPELRFPLFTSKWSKIKLGNLLEFKNGINADKSQYGEGTKFINVLDILNNQTITYENIIGKVNVSKSILENYPVNYGDILFQRSSETRNDVGKSCVYIDKNYTATFGGFVIRGKKIGEYEPIFLNNLLKTNSTRKDITVRSGGSTRYNVGQDTLSCINLYLPTLYEQQKIAKFLSSVDQRIQLLEERKEKLQAYKKGVMQQIFSQQIRFKQEDGSDFPEWENFKGKDLFKNHSNKNHDSDLPILAASQEKGIVLRDENGINIKTSEASIKSYKVVEKGDFVISLRSFQGGIEYSKLKGICSPAYIILKPKKEIDDLFYKYYFKKEAFIERLSKTVIGIRDGKQITYENFGGLRLLYPSINEQKKISSFLIKIDRKLNQTQTQIDKSKEFKKGLLQKMFV